MTFKRGKYERQAKLKNKTKKKLTAKLHKLGERRREWLLQLACKLDESLISPHEADTEARQRVALGDAVDEDAPAIRIVRQDACVWPIEVDFVIDLYGLHLKGVVFVNAMCDCV